MIAHPLPDVDAAHPVPAALYLSLDAETGIGSWTADDFINVFHTRSDSASVHTILQPGDFNSIMPWSMYDKMTDEDLKAVFAYLKTTAPIKNTVDAFTPAGTKNNK